MGEPVSIAAILSTLSQAAAQPTADQVAKATEAANKAAEAANKATEATKKLAASANSLISKIPILSADAFATLLVKAVAIIMVVALMLIYKHVKKDQKWAISNALSEDVPVGSILRGADALPLFDAEGNVRHENVMKASSSRLIALLAAVAIMVLYIGVGLAVLMQFNAKGTVPTGTGDVTTFLLYGMVLFAPYVVNKFSAIFGTPK